MKSQLDSMVGKHGSILADMFGLFREVITEVSGNSKKIAELKNQLEGIESKNDKHATNIPKGV